MGVNRLISPLSEQENNQLRELVEQSVLCGVYSQFSGGLLSDSSFLDRHQPADIQYFARTHQASASPQKSSIIWTCSLLEKQVSNCEGTEKVPLEAF